MFDGVKHVTRQVRYSRSTGDPTAAETAAIMVQLLTSMHHAVPTHPPISHALHKLSSNERRLALACRRPPRPVNHKHIRWIHRWIRYTV